MPPIARRALFGGSFDPVHSGHLEIAQKAREHLDLDEVIFVPCHRSPHKSDQPGASGEERLEMLQLAVEGVSGVRIEDYELRKPPPSYSWETVLHFQLTFPSPTRWFLLIGDDQWESLPRWRNPEILAREVDFIVVGRSGKPKPREGYRAHFIKGSHPASSSAIRANLAGGGDPEEQNWLPEKVAAYLKRNPIYSLIS